MAHPQKTNVSRSSDRHCRSQFETPSTECRMRVMAPIDKNVLPISPSVSHRPCPDRDRCLLCGTQKRLTSFGKQGHKRAKASRNDADECKHSDRFLSLTV